MPVIAGAPFRSPDRGLVQSGPLPAVHDPPSEGRLMQFRARLGVTLAALLTAAFPFAAGPAFAQSSHNMVRLGQLDAYNAYASCWGYTAPDGTELAIIGTDTGASI